MSALTYKIDFAVILTVDHANPNGDPLNGNRPRTDYDGYGEITDVCIKRKLRDRLLESDYPIFVQSDEKKRDEMTSLKNRAESDRYGLGKAAFDEKITAKEKTAEEACKKWFDVRAFGQLFAFKKSTKKKKTEDDEDSSNASGVSIPIRGPVTIQSAFSVEPITITGTQITKSVNGEDNAGKLSSDRMGTKYRVDKGVYVFFGSMNPQLAERTGFSAEDAEVIKLLLPKLFENDASSARPEGSMAVKKVFWWKHNSKAGQYSSARVHKSLKVNPDGTHLVDTTATEGLIPEEIDGF